jgi:hypothetical protein
VIQLISFLLIGALLLVSLYFFARRGQRAEGGSGALVEARQALNTLRAGLLPAELVGRIFARDDLEYIESQASREIRDLFLEERTKVALFWVSRVRKQVLSLRRFHLGSARFYARLNLRTELALAMDFAAILLACRALQVFLYVRGPYAAPRIVGSTAASAARVCKISEESLAFLTPAYAGQVVDRTTRSARS